jgi:murein DD-endopeptidase MepM/ murein hydrolase activator NlpD
MRGAEIALALAIMLLAACSSTTAPSSQPLAQVPITHTVAAGENLYRIAMKYNVSVGRLMAANSITDPAALRVGQSLVIPGAYRTASNAPAPARSVRSYAGAPADRQFQWPVKNGVLSSGFGMRNGSMHDGVDIAANSGAPVMAADSGTVILSGILHGYGNTVIIRHDDRYTTIYAHDAENLVREGDRVARGQRIATVGDSGRTTGANLHFEVRCENVARDPLAYLPPPADSNNVSFAAAGGL